MTKLISKYYGNYEARAKQVKKWIHKTGLLFLGLLTCSCTSASTVTIESQVKELVVYKELGIGPCDDVFVEGDMTYIIGAGKLYIADISDPPNPTIISTVEDLGNTRQICVKNGVAYIVSRENGLFIINSENPGWSQSLGNTPMKVPVRSQRIREFSTPIGPGCCDLPALRFQPPF